MRVAIVGSRSVQNFPIESMLAFIPKNTTALISGGAVGIDSLAEDLARSLKIPFHKFLPDYQRFGKYAPHRRNRQIVDSADYVLAFWDMHSPGTRNVILDCVRRHIPVRIIPISQP